MDTEGPQEKREASRSSFSEQRYAADFGRYEGMRAAEHPAHELLVGREGQRAYFLNLLLTVGRKGAYLVTGHRGAGKTAFVRFCLDEYRENVFRRYLKSNVGRRFFWDRFGHLAFGVLLILAFLLASEVLQELALVKHWSFLDTSAFFLLGLFCFYILLLSYEMLELALEGNVESRRMGRGFLRAKPNFLALLLFWCGALVAWWTYPMGEPAVAVSQLAVVVGWTYFVTILISFNTWEKKDDPGCDDLSFVPARSPKWKNRIGIILISVAVVTVPIWPPLGWGQVQPAAQNIGFLVLRNWLFGSVLIACGALQRGIDLLFLRRELRRKRSTDSVLSNTLTASFLWHVFGFLFLGVAVGLITWLSPGKLWFWDWMEKGLAVGVVAVWLTAAIWRTCEYRDGEWLDKRLPFSLHPRPRVLIAIKALLFLLVGLQLTYPLALALPPDLLRIFTLHVPGAPKALAVKLDHQIPAAALFQAHEQEVLWLASCSLLLLLLVFIEYEWIIRPYAQVRDDVSIHRPSRQVPRRVRAKYQRFAEQTLFWKTFRAWLPVLVVPVNLGFDQLDLRLVIEAMLAGLKDAYNRTFLHWSSAFVAVQRFLWLSTLFVFALGAAHVTFDAPIPEPPVCRNLVGSTGNWLLCSIGGERLVRFMHWAPFRGPHGQVTQAFHPGLWIYQFAPVGEVLRPQALRVYHLVVFALFYVAWLRLRRSLPITPYHQIYRRISQQLDSLSSRLRQELKPDRSKLTELLGILTGSERVEAKEFEPFDPRIVELSLLRILADSQNAAIHFPFATRHRISPPVPEIIFVFDELDKIGVGSAASSREPKSAEVVEREPLDLERERSRALFKLFADLKNVLSSGMARFIFIGGRNLHDEWLADQSARRPLLTNIFDAEIYIPSLLTDESSGQEEDPLLGGVRLLVSEHLQRARHLHMLWRSKIMGPWLRLWVEERRPVTFVQGLRDEGETSKPLELVFHRCDDGKPWEGSTSFYDAFVEFLAYRSRGNPKKMVELLEFFLRPVDRVVKDPRIRRDRFDCDHVLLFRDRDRFRVQLVADIFRQLRPIFKERVYGGDDKLGPGIFYLSDFLLKFHRRAFTWSNLERVDELVHIHRAPDLRAILEALVLNWSERYLHLINNGMYDYRFESDFARELDYLSRQSEPELAAFNFTLDESQSLKITYQARLAQLDNKPAVDFVMGLGELHEFDEEYETARYHYQQALRLIDEEFRFQVGGSGEKPVSFDLLQHGANGLEAARRVAIWGVARVRIMLQIGMTYERSRDLERAHVEYRDARTLASAIIRAFLGWQKGEDDVPGQEWAARLGSGALETGGYLWTLKHLNILLHPVFAEAWLNEKSVSGVDTGPSLLERELWNLRNMLPFVSAKEFNQVEKAVDAVEVQHSNFSLTFAELHNKAGSLYFFKGRQVVPVEQARNLAAEGDPRALQGTEGYLLKALSHYAISLHELRRFNRYRRDSSARKLNDYEHDPQGTFGRAVWPEFVHRVTAGTLGNLAESLLARVSLAGLRAQKEPSPRVECEKPWEVFESLYQELKWWLESSAAPGEDGGGAEPGGEWGELLKKLFPSCAIPDTTLSEWFGTLLEPGEKEGFKRRLLKFPKPHSDRERLATSLVFSLSAARVLEEDGYFEGAAVEYLRVVRTVAHYIWWWNLLDRLARLQAGERGDPWREAFKAPGKGMPPFLEDLLKIAVETLDRANSLLQRSRRSRVAKPGAPAWEMMPPVILSLSCSLALGTLILRAGSAGFSAEIQRISSLLEEWTGAKAPGTSEDPEWFRQHLIDSLDRHSFPMINRLESLKILIDDALIRNGGAETEDYIQELAKLEEMFKSPLHFTPLQSGLTLGLACLVGQPGALPEDSKHRLSMSQQMYTMKRTYYEVISGLYYLYDDFNDRSIHYNHAIQMSGTEIGSYMLALLGET